MKSLHIVGCGDIGKRVARLAIDKNIKVSATVRSPPKMSELENLGIAVYLLDLTEELKMSEIPMKGASVLYTVPPPGGGITDPRAALFCSSITPENLPDKIIYLSTSGVYGDCGNRTINEETPPAPETSRGKRRLAAEQEFKLLGIKYNINISILRVTGIYGPNRIPMDKIISRHPLLKNEESPFTNRIHADDLAEICLKVFESDYVGETYNVCDGQISTMNDYFNAVTDMLGLERLPQITMDEAKKVMTPLMLSYLSESKIVSNQKLLDKLGVKLRYPTLEQGLKACLSGY